jgi:hypothetical protein
MQTYQKKYAAIPNLKLLIEHNDTSRRTKQPIYSIQLLNTVIIECLYVGGDYIFRMIVRKRSQWRYFPLVYIGRFGGVRYLVICRITGL